MDAHFSDSLECKLIFHGSTENTAKSHTHKHSQHGDEHEHEHNKITGNDINFLNTLHCPPHYRNKKKLKYIFSYKALISNPELFEVFRPPIS